MKRWPAGIACVAVAVGCSASSGPSATGAGGFVNGTPGGGGRGSAAVSGTGASGIVSGSSGGMDPFFTIPTASGGAGSGGVVANGGTARVTPPPPPPMIMPVNIDACLPTNGAGLDAAATQKLMAARALAPSAFVAAVPFRGRNVGSRLVV